MTLDEAKELFPEVPKEKPEDAIGYIYVTVNVDEQKFYIGKRSSRWKACYYGGGHYPKLWKMDKANLEHWPIQWCYNKEELSYAEHNWVDKFKDNTDNMNLVEGGGGPTGRGGAKVISEETLQRLRDAFLGENNPFYGKTHTDETKKIISEKNKNYYLTHDNPHKGIPTSESVKEKLRQKAIERNLDPKFRENTRKRLKEYYKTHDAKFLGCQHTEETKEQMSKRKVELFGKERTDYIPNTDKLYGCAKDRIKVICLDTGEVFNSVNDANRAYGVKASHITEVCKGKRRTALGHKWAFYEEENSELSPLPDYSYSNELGFLERKTCLA